MQSVVEVLQDARRLIDERGWTQGAMARDARGNEVSTTSDAAACFCAAGAIDRVEPIDFALYLKARAALRKAAGTPVLVWNDAAGRNKGDVLDLFDRAIALAEGA